MNLKKIYFLKKKKSNTKIYVLHNFIILNSRKCVILKTESHKLLPEVRSWSEGRRLTKKGYIVTFLGDRNIPYYNCIGCYAAYTLIVIHQIVNFKLVQKIVVYTVYLNIFFKFYLQQPRKKGKTKQPGINTSMCEIYMEK